MVGETAAEAPAGVRAEARPRGRPGHRAALGRRPSGTRAGAERGTRERILDVALELFTEKGFDATSLREIAERLGVTKAALYYHFRSKEDILLALHLRVHRLIEDALAGVGGDLATVEAWAGFLDGCIATVLDNRQLLIMHERNRAAFETLHRKDHASRDDPFDKLTATLRGSELSLRDRARIAASLGALVAGSTIAGAGSDVSVVEVAEILREVVRDILLPAAGNGSG